MEVSCASRRAVDAGQDANTPEYRRADEMSRLALFRSGVRMLAEAEVVRIRQGTARHTEVWRLQLRERLRETVRFLHGGCPCCSLERRRGGYDPAPAPSRRTVRR